MVIRTRQARRGGRGWLLAFVILIMCPIVMGLIMVWCNIVRMDTTYSIKQHQNTLNERRALRAKLEVERERLLSPYELKRKAQVFGLREATANQIRRLDN